MSGELTALGALVAGSDWRAAEAAERLAIERGIRASLLCVLLGLEREAAVWPYPAQAAAGRASKAGEMLADLFEPMDGIGQLATLAGAADLDPMDPGPSHTVLPATLAACIASSLASAPPMRKTVTTRSVQPFSPVSRPRGGCAVPFPAPGLASASTARACMARRRGGRRRAGLAPRRDRVCQRHGHRADPRLRACPQQRGVDDRHDALRLGRSARPGSGAARLRRLGCVARRSTGAGLPVRRRARQPRRHPAAGRHRRRRARLQTLPLQHLPEPRGRDARRGAGPAGGPHRDHDAVDPAPGQPCRPATFARRATARRPSLPSPVAATPRMPRSPGPPGPWHPATDVEKLLPHVVLVADRAAPTRLSEASVGVRAWRGGSLVQDSTRAMRDLGSWGVEHARKLMGTRRPPGEVDALYGGSLLQGYEHVRTRRLAQTGQQRSTRG